jgi:hypothetical protein
MCEYPISNPIRKEELKGRLFGSDGGPVRFLYAASFYKLDSQANFKSKWPNPCALPKLARTSIRKNCTFCSLRFIFALFSSNRIKIYLETFRDGRGQRHELPKKEAVRDREQAVTWRLGTHIV